MTWRGAWLSTTRRTYGFGRDSASPHRKYSRMSGSLRRWGVPRRFISGTNVTWSPNGASIAYFVAQPGDATIVADRNGSNGRQIFIAKPGEHCHYPTWSPDGRFIYFVRGGARLAEADVWHIPVTEARANRSRDMIRRFAPHADRRSHAVVQRKG